ncbi:MAG: hypothetical protein RLY93_14370 [Sumerlaeia bacterium]
MAALYILLIAFAAVVIIVGVCQIMVMSSRMIVLTLRREPSLADRDSIPAAIVIGAAIVGAAIFLTGFTVAGGVYLVSTL